MATDQPDDLPIECFDKDGEKLFWFANVTEARTTLKIDDSAVRRVLKKLRLTTYNLVFKLTNEPQPVLTEEERGRRLARVFSVMKGRSSKPDANDQDEIQSDHEDKNDSSDEAIVAAHIPCLRKKDRESYFVDKPMATEEKIHPMFREAPRYIRNHGPDPTHLSPTPVLYTTINPGNALYNHILNHLIQEASLLALQAGAVVRARIVYTHPVSKRQEWRCDPVCIVNQTPFLTNNTNQKQVMVYDGRDLFTIPTDDVILHIEDQILHLLNSQHFDHTAILHGLQTASTHYIQSQWTHNDVQEFCLAMRKVRNSHGYPNLAKLYNKSSFAQYMQSTKLKRSYQDIIDFYYQYRALQKPSSNKYYRLLSVFECSTFIRQKQYQTADHQAVEHILMQQNFLGAKVQLDDRLSPWEDETEGDGDDDIGDTSTVGSMPDTTQHHDNDDDNSDNGHMRKGSAYLSRMSSSRPRPSLAHSNRGTRRVTPLNDNSDDDDSNDNGNRMIKVKIEGDNNDRNNNNRQQQAMSNNSRWFNNTALSNRQQRSSSSRLPTMSSTVVQPSSAAFTRRVVAQIEQNGHVKRLFRSLKAVTRYFDVKGACTLRTALINHSMYNGYYWQDYDGPPVDFLSVENDFIDTKRIENFTWQPAMPWLMGPSGMHDDNDYDDDNSGQGQQLQVNRMSAGNNNTNGSNQRVDTLAIRARIPNIKESRVFYKHRIASPYEVLLWIPRSADMTTRYHAILDKLVRAEVESTLQTRDRERKWSYPYQLLELIQRSKFNALDPDLTTNIYTKLHNELSTQWKSMHKKRLLQTLEQLYSQDHIYDRYIPANSEYPDGFNTPVLSESGMKYFKQMHAQQMSLQEKHELQRTKKLRAQSLAQELQDKLKDKQDSAAAAALNNDNDEIRQFMQRYCVEDMLIALYQLAKFEKTPHVRVICAFFTRYANCPEQWKMMTVNRQVDILRHAYEINTHMTRMIINNGIYSLRLNTPVIPILQAMEDIGEVILDPDREQVFFMLQGMVEYVENSFMPFSITDVYSFSHAAASSFTPASATSDRARGGNRQGTRGHRHITGNKVATPEWNYQNNQTVAASGRGSSSSRAVPNRPGLSHRIGSGPAIRRKGKRQRVEYSDEDEELSEDEDLVIDRRGGGDNDDEDEEDEDIEESPTKRRARRQADDDGEDEQGEEDADLMSVADDNDGDGDDDDEEGSEDMDLVEDKPEGKSSKVPSSKNNRQQSRYEAKTAVVGSSASHHALIGQPMDEDEDEDLQSLASA